MGDISVQIYLLTSPVVYQKFYSNYNFNGGIAANWTRPVLNFTDSSDFQWTSNTTDISAEFYTAIKFGTTGTINVICYWDDYWTLYLDNTQRTFWYSNTEQQRTFSFDARADTYYTLYAKWAQGDSGYGLVLSAKDSNSIKVSISYSLPVLTISSPFNTTIVSEVWGDGFKTGSEQWDDGNTADGDGWRSNWSQEFGWTWSGGSVAAKDTCQEIWGDGRRFNSNSTYWDDHNTNIGDGCSSTWTVEAGWSWSGGNSNSKDTWQELWGDGKRFNSNSIYWDDNNTASGDGCNSVWFIETGWICFGGSASNKDTCLEVWGDGKRFNSNSTYWDDGNIKNSDGCNSICFVETGYTWSGGNSNNKDTWNEIWGDGIRFNSNVTYWDDNNTASGDGWSSTWLIETGWICAGGSLLLKDTWHEIWGDGIRFNLNITYWDDNNIVNSDGCSSSWIVETGWSCTGGSSSSQDIWREIWGDGKRFNSNSTYWDDENIKNSDGCSSICIVETGYTWSGGNSNNKDTWNEIWGDGIRFNSNQTYWDDGNIVNRDGCTSNWSIETGWTCSGGSSTTSDVCKEVWGDGIKFNTNSTYWDDGNLVFGDGWNSTCSVETNWQWLDGDSTHKDQWSETIDQGIYLWYLLIFITVVN